MARRPLIDLTAARLGGMVLAANNEFFAPKENLLLEHEAAWAEGRFTPRGKWMDGWETRRRREPGSDWAIVRLGLPGRVRQVVVDTSFFSGNYPQSCSLEGCSLSGYPSTSDVLGDEVEWFELIPKTALQGDHHNVFAVDVPWRVSHLRLNIFPDGGVARLRVLGDVLPAWPRLGGRPDVASLANGACVVRTSNDFFGHAQNLIMPGDARVMGDGWETRRRRDDGHDWCVVRLAAESEITRAVLDTRHFKGNCPGTATLEGARIGGELPEDLESVAWQPILARTKLIPHTRHAFVNEVRAVGAIDHVRLSIFPDGGMARLRLRGRLTREGVRATRLTAMNAMLPEQAAAMLKSCCHSSRWVNGMLAARPFADAKALHDAAAEVWSQCGEADWREAFDGHPRIGERPAGQPGAAEWSEQEQAGVDPADAELAERLAEANAAYEAQFGHIYLVCASGLSGAELLARLDARLDNDPEAELRIAAVEQEKITHLRLDRLLEGP